MRPTPRRAPLVLVANARMPSHRAQSLQVAQMAGAFARAGAPTTLVYARRRHGPRVTGPGQLWDHYQVPAGLRPRAEAVGCIDWIDALPTGLQYLPARLQELSFGRRAARLVARFDGARVLSREIETAHALRRRPAVFLELHRVPGGRLRRHLLAGAARGAAGLVAISAGVRDDLASLGLDAARVRVEHDAYEPARFADLPGREEARAVLGLPTDRPLVVYTGGLLPWKGVDVLVEAARELREPFFVIAGGMDADVERLRARAAGLEHLRVDGFQPPSRVPVYLAAGDLGVVPNLSRPAISARYTSPLKVFESMAAGLPLVASDLPSLREVLTEDQALFVAPDDPAALAAGIARLLADGDGRAARAAAMGAAAAEHTWDRRAERLLEWMEAAGGLGPPEEPEEHGEREAAG